MAKEKKAKAAKKENLIRVNIAMNNTMSLLLSKMSTVEVRVGGVLGLVEKQKS
ncbi:MAG: hypothetical protein K9J17_17875 [Flavobacteriales bacterium]|nr:hypothetical protein [Flavobacteriales bacterium]